MVEGPKLLEEALGCSLEVIRVYVTPEAAAQHSALLEPLADRSIVAEITHQLAGQLADTKTPQGIFATVKLPAGTPPAVQPHGRYLMLENIQDPGNLGTIIRSADAFGLSALWLSPDTADCYSPKVLRSTMGSVFRLPVYYGDLAAVVGQMHAAGVETWAAMLQPGAVPVTHMPGQGVCAVIGNEGSGVTPELAALCGHTVQIPMTGATESLNAAMAATIIIWEMSRAAN